MAASDSDDEDDEDIPHIVQHERTACTPVLTDTVLFGLLGDFDIGGAALAALNGYDSACDMCTDYLIEAGEGMLPFAIGKRYLVQTETLYYVGELTSIVGPFLIFESASWVHWTGRLSTLLRLKTFEGGGWPEGERRPRLEYVGKTFVNTAKIISAQEEEWELPTESIS